MHWTWHQWRVSSHSHPNLTAASKQLIYTYKCDMVNIWMYKTTDLFIMFFCTSENSVKMAKSGFYGKVVSASDITPTEHWLNVWCIWHTFLETLQECRSHHLTGWIKPDFREMRVSRLFLYVYRSAGKQRCRGAKPPHERRKTSCLQMWRRTLIRVN